MRACLCQLIRVFRNPSPAGIGFGSAQNLLQAALAFLCYLARGSSRRNVAERIAAAGFDMLTSDNLVITAKVYAANTAKATIFNLTPKSITLGTGALYIVVQKKAPLVEASMKRHILAAAFDQNLARAHQQISN